jgi:hypothetical protein
MRNPSISPGLLRQLWSVVEMTQTNLLLNLDDPALVTHLTRDIKTQQGLDSDETKAVDFYLQSKLPLIRDMAQSRLSPGFC